MTTKKLHYVSGFLIALFVGIHLFNHVFSVAGAEKHIEVMKGLRPIYRNIFIETLLLLAVLIQIVSGIKLFIKNRKTATSSFDKLHLYTGLYLAVFFVIHVGAVLTGRSILHLDTNFYFGVAGLNTFPFSLFFIPYYGLAVLSFFGHVAAVHNKKMKRAVFGWTPGSQAKAIVTIGILVTVVVFYGLTNRFHGVAIPKEYKVLVGG